jgi:hypothetical protein
MVFGAFFGKILPKKKKKLFHFLKHKTFRRANKKLASFAFSGT